MAGSLAGKTAIVTGSTSGIGRATALLFGREGANVVVTGRRTALGEQVVQQITQQGGAAIFLPTDIMVTDDLQAMVQAAVDTYGRLDIVINNALGFAPGAHGSVLEITDEGFEGMVRGSLLAIIRIARLAVPEMIKVGGGAIVNIASVHGVAPAFHDATYSTVKAGMINLTRSMAMDLGPFGIRVNAISPGLILTEGFRALTDPDRYADFITPERRSRMMTPERRMDFAYRGISAPALYPRGEPGCPEEVAQACLFLASEAASFITGENLMVDGGLTISLTEALAVEAGKLYRKAFAKEWGIALDEEDA